jgi:hypothetical protein
MVVRPLMDHDWDAVHLNVREVGRPQRDVLRGSAPALEAT